LDVIAVFWKFSLCSETIIIHKEYLVMDLDLFACDETGMQCICVQNFPLPRALMAVWCCSRYWTTRGLPYRGLDDSRTGQLAE